MSTVRRPARYAAGGTPLGLSGQVTGYMAELADYSPFAVSYSSRLSPRALAAVALAGRFRLVSSGHFARALFHDGTKASRERRCRRTLERLTFMGVLKRLPRPVGGWGAGSEGYLYQPAAGGYRAANPHVLYVTELFVRCIEAERAGLMTILDYQGEPQCHEEVGHLILKPDSFARISTDGIRRYRIECDLSSEYKPQLSKKMRTYCLAYDKYKEPTFALILFVVPDEKRKVFVQKVVAKQTHPQLFAVITFSEFIPYLTGAQ